MNRLVAGFACLTAVVSVGCSAGHDVLPASGLIGHTDGATSSEVWLHYDYMVFPKGIDLSPYGCTQASICSEPAGFSTAPDAASIQVIVDAFAAHGIELHIDPHHSAIPGYLVLISDPTGSCSTDQGYTCDPVCVGNSAVTFHDLEAQFFKLPNKQAWRYAIFGFIGDFMPTLAPNCLSKYPDLGDIIASASGETGYTMSPSNFQVTLGLLALQHFNLSSGFTTGATMHELGHTLGLLHGGGDGTNYKNNYFSVMNYEYTFGIPYAASIGSTVGVGFRYDYSEAALPSLDENNLNESLGMQSGTTDIAHDHWPQYFGPFNCASQYQGHFVFNIPSTGPADFNCDGQIESSVQADIQGPVSFTLPEQFIVMSGFNDWQFIQQMLGSSQSMAPIFHPHPDAPPPAGELRALRQTVRGPGTMPVRWAPIRNQ